MKSYAATGFFVLQLVLCLTGTAMAGDPEDAFGNPDRVTAKIASLAKRGQWIVGIYLQNDEELAAITVPLRYGTSVGEYRFDSASYVQTRVKDFALRITNNLDTTNAVQVGLLHALGGNEPPLGPGIGPVAWLYFTQQDTASGVYPPAIDTTFFPPYNHLQLVTLGAEAITPIFETVNSDTFTTFENLGSKTRR